VLCKYDGQAPYYAASRATLQPSLLQRIRKNVRPGARILVAGSGTGMECFALAEEGWQVTGVDFAPRMVELAQQESERRRLAVRFHQADLLQHDEPPGSLAAVLFTYDVYSFLPERDHRCRLLQSMSEWLEPEGCILLSARRASRLYDRWILTLQWLRRGGRRWGHTHTRWVSADGALHRSFVQVHRETSLALEARKAGFQVGTWEAGHALLRRLAPQGP
jgi:SAM-dependent methyltransferase